MAWRGVFEEAGLHRASWGASAEIRKNMWSIAGHGMAGPGRAGQGSSGQGRAGQGRGLMAKQSLFDRCDLAFYLAGSSGRGAGRIMVLMDMPLAAGDSTTTVLLRPGRSPA